MALGLRFFWSALSGIAGYFSRSRPAHPTHLTTQQGIHGYPNPSLPTLDPRNVVGERVSPSFALLSNSLAYSRKSAVILGESGSTVPANTNPHLSSLGLFQSPLTRAKPMADIGGGLVGEDSTILEPRVHHHRMPVKSCRCATVGASRKESG